MGKKEKKAAAEEFSHDDVYMEETPLRAEAVNVKVSKKGNRAAGGADRFGEIQYELMEEKASMGGLYKNKYRVCFYEKVVLIQDENHFLCYPISYSQEVILKYKITAVNITKAKVPTWLFWLACVLFLTGIILMANDDQKDDNPEVEKKGKQNMTIGVVLFIISLIMYAVPFLYVHYFTTFTFAKPPETEGGLQALVKLCISILKFEFCSDDPSNATNLVIKTDAQPDQDFLFNYVYGCMGGKVNEIHAYAHMANDGLTTTFKPISLADLDSLA